MSDKKAVERVESWNLDNIRPYENNVKIHTEEQVKEIAASIKRFGPDQPIVVDGEGVIIKGHGRWMAAKFLGMKAFPTIVRTDLTAAEANASRIVDNRVARTDDDTDRLKMELDELVNGDDFSMGDLMDLGFNQKELDFSLNDFAEMDTDATIADIEDATESQISKTEELVAALAMRQIKIDQAIGFKHVMGDHARHVSDFITMVQMAYPDNEPSEAFGLFCANYVQKNSR